ncbi:anhydro-N-acetylmuramic acid kinase [Minwuia sp.]|uniref:anhydro-N-acetylmuramic acid kinase n=1 Tax=Minwuia sp. TaxID=2493630 RepID=UPI003A9321E8
MSGTSMDAVDVAWLRTDGRSRIEAGPAGGYPYQPDEREAVRAVLGQRQADDTAVSAVTAAHARAIDRFLASHEGLRENLDLIGFHGQTIFHDPANRITVQIGDAAYLADRFSIPVVHDFRSADVAAGGEGAPFASLYHVALAADLPKPLCVLNLGGVGNVTWIGDDDAVLAFDTGPASALMDDWMLARTGEPFDRDGATAASGTADRTRVSEWLEQDYFSKEPPKSLDRNDFVVSVEGMNVADGAATLAEFTILSVVRALEHMPARPARWLVTGGGRHNAHLMRRLGQELRATVEPVEAAGWQGDALEAQAFAWLAVRSLDGLPLSLPSTTNVPEPMTGGVLVQPASISARRRST